MNNNAQRDWTGLFKLGALSALIIVIIFFITFSMLYLSDQYSAAAAPEQKAQLLVSGQTLLAIYNGTGPFVAYLFYAVSGILVSVVMLQTRRFAAWVAIAGIIGNVLELGLPPALNPPFFMTIDPFLIGIGGIILLFWYVAIAVKLFSYKSKTQPVKTLSGAVP